VKFCVFRVKLDREKRHRKKKDPANKTKTQKEEKGFAYIRKLLPLAKQKSVNEQRIYQLSNK
jgi:hypothetical protein